LNIHAAGKLTGKEEKENKNRKDAVTVFIHLVTYNRHYQY